MPEKITKKSEIFPGIILSICSLSSLIGFRFPSRPVHFQLELMFIISFSFSFSFSHPQQQQQQQQQKKLKLKSIAEQNVFEVSNEKRKISFD